MREIPIKKSQKRSGNIKKPENLNQSFQAFYIKAANGNRTLYQVLKESAEWSRNMRQLIRDVENREQNKMNDFLTKHKDVLDKGREMVRRERDKSYFS